MTYLITNITFNGDCLEINEISYSSSSSRKRSCGGLP